MTGRQKGQPALVLRATVRSTLEPERPLSDVPPFPGGAHRRLGLGIGTPQLGQALVANRGNDA